MIDEGRPADAIEQSMCRQRTDEEQRAVEMSTLMRMLVKAGAHEIRLDPGHKPFNLD